MSDTPAWRVERDARGIVTLWLDRPGSSQNSLDPATFAELARHLDAVAADATARGLVVRSGKPRGFCAGADLKFLAACPDEAAVEAAIRAGWAALDRFERLGIPSVALIHGTCLGGGLELALACDQRLILAGENRADARLGTPEVLLGLVPGWGAIAALPRLIGLEAALTLLLQGEAIDADEALRIGLATDRVGPENLDDRLAELLFDSCPATVLPWPPARAYQRLDEARRALPTGDDGPSVARHRVLDVLAVELTDGPGAGREAAIRAVAELAASPAGLAALATFVGRHGPGPAGVGTTGPQGS